MRTISLLAPLGAACLVAAPTTASDAPTTACNRSTATDGPTKTTNDLRCEHGRRTLQTEELRGRQVFHFEGERSASGKTGSAEGIFR